MKKIWWLVFALAVIGGGITLVLSLRDESSSGFGGNEPLEIGHDTTRLLEPRTPDGRVDYIAALNAVQVPAADQNAAIPLLRLFGGSAIVGSDRAEVLAQLGMTEALPAEGRFVSPSEDAEIYTYYDGPLDEYATKALVEWVAQNEKAFRDIVAASNRTHLWLPYVRNPDGGMFERALAETSVAEVAELLRARAELRLAEGDVSRGWEDAHAIIRLYVLADQKRGALGRLVAGSIRSLALEWVQRALAFDPPSAELCLEMLNTLQSMPTPEGIEYDFDVTDRYQVLDLYMEQTALRAGAVVGINPALRVFNTELDKVTSHLVSPDPGTGDRLTQMADVIATRTKALTAGMKDPMKRIELGLDIGLGGERGPQLVGQVLATMVIVLVPSTFHRVFDPKRHIASVALACHLHRLRNGSFPDSLDALVPSEFAELPTHDITSKRVAYERTADGCRVGEGDPDDGDYVIVMKSL